MDLFAADNHRNIALMGHGGSGKTSLAEAMLFKAGATTRLGSTADKTSVLDFSEEEKEKGSSIHSAVCHLTHNDLRVNIIDTPGVQAYTGEAIAALAAVELAVIVISAPSGIQVNTRKMFKRARDYGLGVWFVITHIDAANIDLGELVQQIHETFGNQCATHNLPCNGGKGVVNCFRNKTGDSDIFSVEEVHTELIEAVVGSDDELMERYLEDKLSDDEARKAAASAVAHGDFMPIFFADSLHDVGVQELLDALLAFCPSPCMGQHRELVAGEDKKEIAPTQDGPFVGQVFKISSDPKSHIKYLNVRVHSGKLTPDMTIHSTSHPKGLRPGHTTRTFGAEHKDIEAGVAGDIVSLAKLDFQIGDTLLAEGEGTIDMPVFPKPMYSLAIESEGKGDADKMGAALKQFEEEDPCFYADRGTGGELVIHGMGELQLRSLLTRMDRDHKVKVTTRPPRIPYRETIQARSDNVEYTHKKQSGGSGQFGRVIINVYPSERGEGYEFIDKIFGGSIDQAYRPSVDKGIKAQMEEGVLAGYPVVDVKVELIDGKTHPVDSKDIAFQIAGRGAFKDGFMKAKPCLLEPIVDVEVTVPTDHVGDITGDLASRRGRPQGQDMLPGSLTVVQAQVPLAEMSNYNSSLSSITGGQGSFTMEFSHYEVVPSNIQQQVVEEHKKQMEEEGAHH